MFASYPSSIFLYFSLQSLFSATSSSLIYIADVSHFIVCHSFYAFIKPLFNRGYAGPLHLQRCVKSVQIRSFFWSVFSCIWTEYGDLLRKSPYLVRIQENANQKKLRISTLFTQCRYCCHFRISGLSSTSKSGILAFCP